MLRVVHAPVGPPQLDYALLMQARADPRADSAETWISARIETSYRAPAGSQHTARSA